MRPDVLSSVARACSAFELALDEGHVFVSPPHNVVASGGRLRRPPSNSKARCTLTSRGRSASKRSSARRSPMQSGWSALRGAGTRVTFLTEDETGHSFPGAETLRAYSERVDEAVAPCAALPKHEAGRLCRPASCV